MSDFEPRFEARPSGPLGDGWNVHVSLTTEKVGLVTGFSTQYEALDWIKYKSANWVADYILREPKF
jgi:hypothetical protein